MSALRRVLLAVGVVLSLVGLAIVADPSLAARIQVPDVPRIAVGAVAFLFAWGVFHSRRHTDFRDASEYAERNERLENRLEPPRPGDDIDAELGRGLLPGRGYSPRVDVRQRLRRLTIQVLRDVEGVSRGDAVEQLRRGTWTDDRTAAAFFAEGVSPPAATLVGSVLGYESAFERKASHVVAELERMVGTRREDG